MVDSTMTGTGGSLVQRMIRAARLDTAVYEELEADRTATGQAATAVVIVAVAGAIGQGLNVALNAQPGGPAGPWGSVLTALVGALGALLGWVIWSYVAHFIGTRFFGGTADTGELLRTIGFAQSPGRAEHPGLRPRRRRVHRPRHRHLVARGRRDRHPPGAGLRHR